MKRRISKHAREEIIEAVRQRYRGAPKRDKTKILDELVALTGCHRKHAVRLLKNDCGPPSEAPVVSRRIYDEAVREALIVLWEAADRICGKRLKAILPSLLDAMERHDHVDLESSVRTRLLSASADLRMQRASSRLPPGQSSLESPMRAVQRGRRVGNISS